MKRYCFLTLVICILTFAITDAFSQQKATFNVSQSTPGQLREDLNGKLLRKKGDTKIYWIDNGVRRHVESIEFIFIDSIEEYMDVHLIKEGAPLNKDARLIRCIDKGDKNEGAIYLLDNGHIRHITTMNLFKKYTFDIKKVIDVPCPVISAIAEVDVPFK